MVKRRWLVKKRSSAEKIAIMEILKDSEDPELLKGFLACHGAMFLEEGDPIQIYGMMLEVLYDIKTEDIKRSVVRIIDQQERDLKEEIECTPAGEFAVRCAKKYRSTFQ